MLRDVGILYLVDESPDAPYLILGRVGVIPAPEPVVEILGVLGISRGRLWWVNEAGFG